MQLRVVGHMSDILFFEEIKIKIVIKIVNCCGVCLKLFSQKGPKFCIVVNLICKIHDFFNYFFPHPKSNLMIGNSLINIITTF